MRNFNEGVDPLINSGLAGLPTANKLWLMLCDQQESDTDPTMVFANLTQTAATATFQTAALTCSSRQIALGGAVWTETTPTTSRSFVVLTANVGSSPKLVAIQNITDGSTWSNPTKGPPLLDGLTIKIAYQSEA